MGGTNSILKGWHACNCALPSLTGSTECCKYCGNRNSNLDFEPATQKFIEINPSSFNIKEYINYPECMMYVLPKNILNLMELLGDTYNITIYKVKVIEGKKYLVVGLSFKKASDELKDAVVNINFFED